MNVVVQKMGVAVRKIRFAISGMMSGTRASGGSQTMVGGVVNSVRSETNASMNTIPINQ